jgi:hypothetical protein
MNAILRPSASIIRLRIYGQTIRKEKAALEKAAHESRAEDEAGSQVASGEETSSDAPEAPEACRTA